MADVRKYIQINPIDDRENVALGVSLPFNAEGVFYSTYTTKEQVKSNLLNILLTEPGERIFNPLFGVGLRQLLFENETNPDQLRTQINQQVETYLPQITITDIQASRANQQGITYVDTSDGHILYIRITFRVNQTNETDTIQLNFNTGGGGGGY
tara:strand:+ start:346 stop:807 length:462 start_codon:yes stop_codon:yes gene_type:complete